MSKRNDTKELLVKPDKKFFKVLKQIIGFRPRVSLLYYQKAFIHKSATKQLPNGHQVNNERLEYLGDAILDAIIADYLFTKFPNKDEGFLTQMRSKIVNRDNLNHLSLKLGINHLVVSNTANSQHKYLYGDAFEALIGALYIDKGFRKAKKIVVKRILDNHVNLKKLISIETDFKSRIIEWGQKNRTNINFESSEESIENSNDTLFVSHLLIGSEIKGRGSGNSKKEAEQNAAKQALKSIVN